MGGRLQDKTALVTGSTSNIGKAIAEAFAAEGPTSSYRGAIGHAARTSSRASARPEDGPTSSRPTSTAARTPPAASRSRPVRRWAGASTCW